MHSKPSDADPSTRAPREHAGDISPDGAPELESSIEARRAAADPDSDEISGDTPDSRMPQL